jgi:hypothetical protein
MRRPTDKTIEEVLQIALEGKGTLWNFIYRPNLQGFYKDHYNVGCSTMGKPNYFLWITLSKANGNFLISKHKLEKIK